MFLSISDIKSLGFEDEQKIDKLLYGTELKFLHLTNTYNYILNEDVKTASSNLVFTEGSITGETFTNFYDGCVVLIENSVLNNGYKKVERASSDELYFGGELKPETPEREVTITLVEMPEEYKVIIMKMMSENLSEAKAKGLKSYSLLSHSESYGGDGGQGYSESLLGEIRSLRKYN